MVRGRNRGYNNWINSLRSNYSRDLERRVREEVTSSYDGPTINKVERIHWYIKDNAKQHNTIKFDQVHEKNNPKPVFRRGQVFYLAIRFSERDVDVNTDRIILNFSFGPRPSVSKGTMGVVGVKNSSFTRTKDEWDARVDPGTRGRDLVIQVYVPATVPVGIWRLTVRTGVWNKTGRRDMLVHKDDTDVFILFNPWCKDDLVFMEDENARDEYVMNDKGKVYVDNYKTPRGRPWAYGQFDDVVLPVAVYILEVSRVPHTERGNPVQVVRAISAGANDFDEDGILEGKWAKNADEYSDGVAPYQWTGSVRILEEYVQGGYEPVKYGQCWVFSAVVTTICRALGIPCRSVTNYVSAHDTNSSLTIDNFFDKEGNKIEGGPDGENYDSIWNFHVWNDVWMARPDLPPGYGGWQAIDGTPQEASDNKMQCGPASVEAIRRGDIGLGFDGPFVFAEVNADVIVWGEDEESDWGFSRLKTNKFHVGRMVVTRKPGEEDDFGEADQDNILGVYKNEEGSAAERLAIHNAIRASKRAQLYYDYKKDVKEDVEFDLVEIDKISIGDRFKIKLVVRSVSDETRTVSVALTAKSVYYTGVHHSVIKKADGKITLKPNKEQELTLTIDYKEYWKHLQEQCMIKMYAICRVQETGQSWTEEDDFKVVKPPLEIQVPANIVRGEECEITFSFKNPLDEDLTDCKLNIDGSGLLRPRIVDLNGKVEAKGTMKYVFKFIPRIHGDRKIIANFNSKQLFEIMGSKALKVIKK